MSGPSIGLNPPARPMHLDYSPARFGDIGSRVPWLGFANDGNLAKDRHPRTFQRVVTVLRQGFDLQPVDITAGSLIIE